MLAWRPAGDFPVIWNDESPASPPPAVSPGAWRYAVDGKESSERVTFGMLQVLAASGSLAPDSLVFRDGMAAWRKAGQVRGLFGGPTEWCPGCDAAFPRFATHCSGCGQPQRKYEPTHREIILPCGILGVCLFPFVPLWLISLILARRDRTAIEEGRSDPAGLESARLGELLGWCGCGLTGFATVAVAAWIVLSR